MNINKKLLEKSNPYRNNDKSNKSILNLKSSITSDEVLSFPKLVELDIMGSCELGSSGLCKKKYTSCYSEGLYKGESDMPIDPILNIIDECKRYGSIIQLGGKGDPDQHKHFKEITIALSQANVKSYFATSGLHLTAKQAEMCKDSNITVAVHWYRDIYTFRALNRLIEAGVQTNIHFTLDETSIDEAIHRLKRNDFPKGVNSVVFLPTESCCNPQKSQCQLGRLEPESTTNNYRIDNNKFQEFLESVQGNPRNFGVILDSCPVLQNTRNSSTNYTMLTQNKLEFYTLGNNSPCRCGVIPLGTCKGTCCSIHITLDLTAMPCKFLGSSTVWASKIAGSSISLVWNSKLFKEYREMSKYIC